VSAPGDESLIRAAISAAGSVGPDDVPIGAVVVDADGVELARAANAREALADPTAPVLGSHAPNTTRATLAMTSAPAHMVQGSTVTASVAPSNRQPSPWTRAAARRARISA
jgi:tRNA(adenine34) deaminase